MIISTAIVLVLLFCVQLIAKPYNRIAKRLVVVQGVVSDTNGDPILNAEVRIFNISNVPALTNDNGFYHIQRGIISSGFLFIRVSKPGYTTMTKTNIIVSPDGPFSFVVDCTLPFAATK